MSLASWRPLVSCLFLLGLLAPELRAQETPVPPTPAGVDSVVTLTDAQRFAEAESLAWILVGRYEVEFGENSFEVGRALDALCEARARQGGEKAGEETVALADRAIAIKRDRLGPDHPEVARSLGGKAVVLLGQRDLEGAIAVRQEALAILRQHPDGDPVILASTLTNLGVLHGMMARYDEAAPYFEEAYELYSESVGDEDPDTGLAAFSLGNIHYVRADYARAQDYYRRSLDCFEAALEPGHPRILITLYSLGNVSRTRGDYAAAREYFGRGLELGEESEGPESPQLIRNLRGLCTVEILLGNEDQALAYADRALAIAGANLAPDAYELWPEEFNVGYLLVQLDRPEEARPHLARAVDLVNARDPNLDQIVEPLCQLAVVEREAGEFAAAVDTLTRALTIADEVLGPTHNLTGDVHSYLASVYASMDEPASALPHLDAAVACYESGWRDRQNYARVLLQRSKARLATDDGDGAFADAIAGEEAAREHFVSTLRTLSEREGLTFAGFRGNGIPLQLTLLAGDESPPLARVAATWDAVVRSRSLLLDETSERMRLAGNAANPDLADLSAVVLDTRTRLANLYLQGPAGEDPARFTARLEALAAEKEAAEAALAAESAQFREASARRAGFEAVAGAIPEGGALVAFVRYAKVVPGGDPVDTYAAFVARGASGPPAFVDLGAAASIDEAVAAWRDAVSASAVPPGPLVAAAEARVRETGERLRDAVLDPLPLDGRDPVFVVPDGALHLVNPAALPATDGTYLVESGPLFHVLPTESALLAEPADAAGDGGLLALGGPAFGEGSPPTPEQVEVLVAERLNVPQRGLGPDCDQFLELAFPDLPGSAKEAEEVAGIWADAAGSDAVTLIGAEATETAFKASARGHSVLHLATHGYFLEGGCARERGADADPEPLTDLVRGNPMLLSGLALAGSNERWTATGAENGILTAEEIAALDLVGVRWVVLSACDTGRGELLPSEGLYGLQRAFQTAGVRTVVMSLWEVDDEATRSWMRSLYRERWETGASTAESVRGAARALLRELRDAGGNPSPVTWGAFVASGDWR